MLRCPNCKSLLVKDNNTYHCIKGHSFDIAKSGYTNLLVHTQKSTGDNKEMVKARNTFFKKDYYVSLKRQLLEIIRNLNIDTMIDAGCGEGYYTNYIKDYLDINIHGFDMSKYALNYASKANKKVNYFVSSIFDLPLIDNSVDLVLSIFAPISEIEFRRILKDEGYFIKVSPHKRHLWELKELLYDKPYENEIKDFNYQLFDKVDEYIVKDVVTIGSSEDLKALFIMTPYYYHTSKEDIDKLNNVDKLDITLEFYIEVYKTK